MTLSLTSPAQNATNVPTSAEIAYQATGAKTTAVELVGPDGPVPGELRSDGSSWVPGRQLRYAKTYQLKITGTSASGENQTITSAFTTMAEPSDDDTVGSGLYVSDGKVVGMGMPIVIELGRQPADRAALERRLFVRSDPPQVGAWHWYNGKELHYRPKEYWKPGTKIAVRLGLGGFPFGNGQYGSRDRSASVTVAPNALMIEVNNATKAMTVIQNGQPIRSIPVSLGKAGTPTDSGGLVVMEMSEEDIFDSSTNGIPVDSPDGYRVKVYFTFRLTWAGQFIHAAPWSVQDQGQRNVSHGCTNISMENARWLYGITHVGTPVVVKNTERRVQKGNGWTDWDMTWEQFVAGSALPH